MQGSRAVVVISTLLACVRGASTDQSETEILFLEPQISDSFSQPECQRLRPPDCLKKTKFKSNAWCNALSLAYVKNGKAASKEVKFWMRKACPGPVLPEKLFQSLPLDAADFSSGEAAAASAGNYSSPTLHSFTLVREPYARVMSAYAEIDSKCEEHGLYGLPRLPAFEPRDSNGGVRPPFLDIERGTEPRRFLVFLDDLFAGRIPQVCGPAHAHVQTQTVCSLPRSAVLTVGRVENFTEHLHAIRWLDPSVAKAAAVTPSAARVHRRRRLRPARPEVQQGSSSRSSSRAKAHTSRRSVVKRLDRVIEVEANDAIMRRICALYASDYACLGYTLPAPCVPSSST